MIALATLALLTLAATGLGAATLRVLGLLDSLDRRETVPWCFGIGFGWLGLLVWAAYAAGITGATGLSALLAAAALPSLFLVRRLPRPGRAPGWLGLAIFVGLAAALSMDLVEGLAPPVDADSMAYHFYRPLQFIGWGEIRFIPFALTGAVPLGVQLAYLPALEIGGEQALTLWCFLSGWMAVWMVYGLVRRAAPPAWSGAVALVFATVPAMLYSAGAGHAEPRQILFVTIAAVAAAETVRTGSIRWVLLAGLAAGFFAASKYTGLLMMAACGLLILSGPSRLRNLVLFSAAAAVVSSAWYLRNYLHTGDPVFPALYQLLPYRADFPWGDAQQLEMGRRFGAEVPVPPGLFWILAYPFKATFDPLPIWEAARTGFGVFPVLFGMLAAIGAYRRRTNAGIICSIMAIAFIFYVLWFYFGGAQRVRHLLPLYGILAAGFGIAGWRAVERSRLLYPAALALAAISVIQLGGQALFTKPFASYLVSGESKRDFYLRTIDHFAAIDWINHNLGPDSLVLHELRRTNYLFQVPSYYVDGALQAVIDMAPDSSPEAARFLHQATAFGATHVLIAPGISGIPDLERPGMANLVRELVQDGCAQPVRKFDTRLVWSRTLGSSGALPSDAVLVKLTPDGCNPG